MELDYNYKMISATQNVPARSLIEGDLTKHIKNPIEKIFPRPYDQENGIIRPLLCDFADYCLKNGIASENIPAACIASLTLNSAALGYPMAIILKADDPMIVGHLLSVCKGITPIGRYIEFQKLSSEELFQKPDSFTSKTIICTSPKGCKGAIHDIQNLISTGCSYRQVLSKSNFEADYKEVSIKGSIAFIGVEIGDEKFEMNDPSVLRITLSANESDRGLTILGYRNFQSNDENRSGEKSRIKRFFERLSYKVVSVPYSGQIISHFMNQRVEKIQFKHRPVHNLLSLISITNNPPPLTKEEAFGYLIGQSPKEFIPVTLGVAIMATKVEYFQMTQLLKDIIPSKEEHYTPVQITVFEAVKRINLAKLSGSTIDKKNEIQVLMTLYKSNNYWAKIGDIFERVNLTEKNRILIQEIEKELNKLAKLGIITKKRFQQTSDYGYYINDTSIGQHVTFLDPSEINDSKFNKAKVQVVNPLTGMVGTI